MLPLMGGMIVGSTLAGQMVSRTGQYRPLMLVGASLLLVGVSLMAFFLGKVGLPVLCLMLLVVGLGLGPGQSLFNIATQNAVAPRDIGVATSSNQFFRQIGSTVGAALAGALLTHRLASQGGSMDLGALQGLAIKTSLSGGHAAVDASLQNALIHAVQGVMEAGALVVLAGLVTILFIPVLPLRSRMPTAAPVLVKDEATTA
jgi:predicted MFS family arabinose efflux permease